MDVVSNFLGDELSDVLVLGVLDADLISVVGGNLFRQSIQISHRRIYNSRTYYAKSGTEKSNRVLDGGIALSLVQAVTARLVEGSEGVGVESSDVVLATEGVVLEDLVGGIESTTTDDSESVRRILAEFEEEIAWADLLSVQSLGGQGIFADIFPPD